MHQPHKAPTLRLYALGLLLIGIASVCYNPEAGVFQWYAKGMDGLLMNGISAVVVLVLSFFAAKDKMWAHVAAAALIFMLLIVGFKNGFVTGRGVSSANQPQFLWYKGALFSAAGFISLLALMPLLLYIRHAPASDS